MICSWLLMTLIKFSDERGYQAMRHHTIAQKARKKWPEINQMRFNLELQRPVFD